VWGCWASLALQYLLNVGEFPTFAMTYHSRPYGSSFLWFWFSLSFLICYLGCLLFIFAAASPCFATGFAAGTLILLLLIGVTWYFRLLYISCRYPCGFG